MTAQVGRFTVRDVNLWDAADLLSLFGDEETVRYMGLPRLQNIGDATALITRYQSSPTKWLIVHDRTGWFLGVVGLEIKGYQATVTIAFRRTREARGAGREFSKPFVQWIFTHPQIWRVWAYCHVDNIPVQRVLERMGAVREGCLRRFEFFPNISDEPQDVFVYAIVR
jgi:[ribosomal protein S5]-alanine N-acetyltransferase